MAQGHFQRYLYDLTGSLTPLYHEPRNTIITMHLIFLRRLERDVRAGYEASGGICNRGYFKPPSHTCIYKAFIWVWAFPEVLL